MGRYCLILPPQVSSLSVFLGYALSFVYFYCNFFLSFRCLWVFPQFLLWVAYCLALTKPDPYMLIQSQFSDSGQNPEIH